MSRETLKLPVFQGLRPEFDLIYDMQYQNEAQNLYLNKNGVFEAEKFTRVTYTGTDLDGISAQVFVTLSGVFVATLKTSGTDTLYSLSGVALTSEVGSLTYSNRGEMWSCADFGAYLIFANINNIVVRDVATENFSKNNALFPLSNAICAHRGRLILIGADPTTFGGGADSGMGKPVVWSKINDLKFQVTGTPDISNQSGWMHLEHFGEPLMGFPLKQHIIIYGENGVSAYTLAGPLGYGMTTIHPLGIKDAGSVCVNGYADGITLHYFIDVTGDLFVVDASLKVTKIGYKEHFAAEHTTYPGLIMMSYNSRLDEVLINFYGSDKTYVYSGLYGLTWINGDIEQMWEVDGTRYVHSPNAITQSNIVYQTNIFDMDCECQKALWGFSARIATPEDVSVVIDYRETRTGAWTSTPAITFSKMRSYFNASRLVGIEFRIKLTVSSYTAFRLSDLEIVYNKISGGSIDA
jgi:hypothetical protein